MFDAQGYTGWRTQVRTAHIHTCALEEPLACLHAQKCAGMLMVLLIHMCESVLCVFCWAAVQVNADYTQFCPIRG